MNLGDPQLELRFMRTLLGGAPQLFYKTDKTWFGSTEVREVWERVNNLNRLGKSIPSLYSMAEDPVLSVAARAVLKGDIPLFAPNEHAYAMGELDKYRKCRIFYHLLSEASLKLSEQNPDMEEIRLGISKNLTSLSTANLDESVLSLGRDNEKAQEFYTKTMDEDVSFSLVRTGINALDTQGGFSREGVYVIAANSGGGKSILANQIAMNMATMFGESVGYVSLEMDRKLCLFRAQANLCTINQSKFIMKTLTKEEREYSDSKFNGLLASLKAQNSPLDYLCLGGEGYDIYKLLNFLEPLEHKVIVLDYANLLEMIDKKAGLWWNLGEMARLLKVYAQKYKKCIIFLAQTDENTGKIKYAQAITHHSDGILTWQCTKKEKELGVVDIEQPKMRLAEPIVFPLGIEFAYARFTEKFGLGAGNTAQALSQTQAYKPQTKMNFE